MKPEEKEYKDRTLSDHLKMWRADRPDEWKMDEFIRMAEALQEELETDEIKVCLGCGHTSNIPIKKPCIACCPDSNYVPVKKLWYDSWQAKAQMKPQEE